MEDFVTFEIAKKLEEKGFNEGCYKYYENKELKWSCSPWLENQYNRYVPHIVAAPTISQVLKWLREEKKIHIQILFTCPPNRWEYITVKMTNNELRGMCTSFTSYEQAAIAGIEYVLDNLI